MKYYVGLLIDDTVCHFRLFEMRSPSSFGTVVSFFPSILHFHFFIIFFACGSGLKLSALAQR